MSALRLVATFVLTVAALLAATAVPALARSVPATMSATVDVNLLFVGFERKTYVGHEDEPHDFRAIYGDVIPWFLPEKNDPVIREESRAPELLSADHHLNYRHHVAFASEQFEQRFFEHLTRVGRIGPRTEFQRRYNAQANNVVDIPAQVLRIPGTEVERWLLRHATTVPGLAPQGDTIVFVNWYGRPGFQFHVYQGEGADPDTGLDGRVADVAGSAWGGSHGRLWFYDFSAGPDAATFNYLVDRSDLDGDGFPEGRIPPIWESRGEGLPEGVYPDVTASAGNLAYHALFGQFASSPLYDPLTSAPRLGSARILRTNLFQGDPGVPREEFLHPAWVQRNLQALQPEIPLESTLVERPLAGEDLAAFEIFTSSWSGNPPGPGCWTRYGTVFAQLYCHVRDHEADFAAPGDPGDWVMPAMAYNIDDAAIDRQGWPFVILGYADWDEVGKPYATFSQSFPRRRNDPHNGYALSHLLIHEQAHHIGLSHMSDGWDGQTGRPFVPYWDLWLRALEECMCPMGTVHRGGFGVFDRDNVNRNLSARLYAEAARRLDSLGAADAARVEVDLRIAQEFFAAGNYGQALRHARTAHDRAGHPKQRHDRERPDKRIPQVHHGGIDELPGRRHSEAPASRVRVPKAAEPYVERVMGGTR